MLNSKKEYTIAELCEEIDVLSNIFDSIILIDPIKNDIIDISEYSIRNTKVDCSKRCMIGKTDGDCICKQIVSIKQDCTQFQFTGSDTYYILSRPLRVRNRDLVMQIASKVTKNLHLGGGGEAGLVNSIKKYSAAIYLDEFTGAYNRKFLAENIAYILEKADYDLKNVCVACIDIDNFKRFNDKYGHSFGDVVLKTVTNELKRVAKRKDDYVIRVGGDEFVIVMQELEKKQFIRLMTECCENVESLKLQTDKGDTTNICISIGCSSTVEDNLKTYEQLSSRADEKLYVSKERGKNCAT